jgi:hypothetical protein
MVRGGTTVFMRMAARYQVLPATVDPEMARQLDVLYLAS